MITRFVRVRYSLPPAKIQFVYDELVSIGRLFSSVSAGTRRGVLRVSGSYARPARFQREDL